MKFSKITIAIASGDVSFLPYDRGQNGAFVYRQEGVTVYAPRVIASATTDDAKSDKLTVQINTPRVVEPAAGCCDPVQSLGTDLLKTEMRFLASTSKADRVTAIDTHIALLQNMRTVIEDREVIYV